MVFFFISTLAFLGFVLEAKGSGIKRARSFASGKGSEKDKAALNEEALIANSSQSLHSLSIGANVTCI